MTDEEKKLIERVVEFIHNHPEMVDSDEPIIFVGSSQEILEVIEEARIKNQAGWNN